MGTRSLTFVYDGNVGSEVVMNMYRQYDGYVSGHGVELAEFLQEGRMVNGIPVGDNSRMFNGMGCLAAQMIAQFKSGPGGFYLYPASATDCGQDYEYHVYYNRVIVKNPSEVIFDGSFEEFFDFCYEVATNE